MFTWFIKGGPMMLALLSCSIWGVYIIVYKLLFIRSNLPLHNSQVDRIKTQLSSVGKERTLQEIRTARNLSLRITATAIKSSDLPFDEAKDNIRTVFQNDVNRLDRDMNILAGLITIAPILGLLGTVMGLMDIFSVISGGDIGDATALSGGISEALITTVTGMAIAVPFVLFYQYLSYRMDVFTNHLSHLAHDVLRYCQNHPGVKP